MPDSLKTYHKSKKLYDGVKDSVEHTLRINAEKLASMQVPEQVVTDSTNHKNRKLQILKAQIQDVEDALYSAQADGNTKDANILLRRLHKLEDDAKKLKDIEKKEEEEPEESEEEKKKRLEEEAKKKEEEAKKK